ncbi:hypothetical protein ACQ4PT_045822 [Festuca glaucescens]
MAAGDPIPCLNCNIAGHYTARCPTIRCDRCKKLGHIAQICQTILPWECAPSMCGFQAPGRGFFYMPDQSSSKLIKERATSVVITIIEGNATCREIEQSFNIIFGDSWRCTARAIGPNQYTMRFPTPREVERAVCYGASMKLKTADATVSLSPWTASVGAKAQLQKAWVKISNIPLDKRCEANVFYAGGLIGVSLDLEASTLHKPEYVKVLIGCRDIEMIPPSAEGCLGDNFYDFYYEVDKIVVGRAPRDTTNVAVGNSGAPSPKRQRFEQSNIVTEENSETQLMSSQTESVHQGRQHENVTITDVTEEVDTQESEDDSTGGELLIETIAREHEDALLKPGYLVQSPELSLEDKEEDIQEELDVSRCSRRASSDADTNIMDKVEKAAKKRNLEAVCFVSTVVRIHTSQPKPVAALIGGGADGLQMFTSLTSKKIDAEQSKQAIAIVTVHSGVVNAQQLVDAFSKQFQWGWEWKAKSYMKNSFLVKFPSAQKIDEMKAFNFFGLVGHKATVRVNRWTNSYMARYKLYTVWVKISGVPETMLHYPGFCEAASLIGKVFAIDMELYRSCEVIRAKVGVKDPRKIPFSAPLNDEEFIYDIFFELEDIVEEGGPLMSGVLISNNDTVRNSEDDANVSGELKRPRENSQSEASQNSKSPKNTDNVLGDEEFRVDAKGEQFASSQEELDVNLQEEKETRQKLLAEQEKQSGGLNALKEVNATFARDSALMEDVDLDDEELDFDCTQDPDSFARKIGLGTQAIKEINEQVEREMEMDELQESGEHNKENVGPDFGTKEDVTMGDSLNSKSGKMGNNREEQGQMFKGKEKILNQKNTDAEVWIQKAKEKAAADEAETRRRSVRNKDKEDTHTMDKTEDMARKKNLEHIPGKENFPTVLNTVSSFIVDITRGIGVSLGNNEEEVEKSISMIKELEHARCNLCLANKRKEDVKDLKEESKLESFDPVIIRDLMSDFDIDEEDEELNEDIMSLASIFCGSRKRTSPKGYSVKAKSRGRKLF